MKTIKSLKTGVLCRVFENGREFFFVISGLLFFPLSTPRRLLTEQSLWKTVMPQMGESPLDVGMPKPRGEVLVTGRAYPPGGPRPACSVRVQVGPVDKTLYVVGERTWAFTGPTPPEPFQEMPIDWPHAFGGPGFELNPLGKGLKPVRGPDGKERHPLPNIEDPARLIQSPKDKPPPAGFGAYDFTWPQRFSKIGTYDQEWLKTRSPGFAKDLDLALFSTAPEDQRIEGYFRGDEPFRIENMHPERPVLEGRLPGLGIRAFITHRPEGKESSFREATMRLETIHLFPHIDRGLMLFRGMLRIEEDDADDVVHLLLACESLESPRPVEHYQEVLAKRLDRKHAHLHSLRDGDLMPPPEALEAGGGPDAEVALDVPGPEGFMQRNQRRSAEKRREETITRCRELGVDPAAFKLDQPLTEPDPPPKDFDRLPEYVIKQEELIEQHKAEAERRRVEGEAMARKICADKGIDFEKFTADARRKSAGPPKFKAKEHVATLQATVDDAKRLGMPLPHIESMLQDPRLLPRLEKQEMGYLKGYRKFAHYFPEGEALEGDAAERVRSEVEAAVARGEPLSGRDLTGANLSGMDLSGAKLDGAFLEKANLAGAKLSGADLTDAVLARASLAAADLSGARLHRTNFGRADLVGADLGGADLHGTILHEADLRRASLRGARLLEVDMSGAKLSENDMTGIQAKKVIAYRAEMSNLRGAGGRFTECAFLESPMVGADFTGATMDRSVFVSARGDGAIFRDASLDNLRIVHESSFPGADFKGAKLTTATLRGTNFEKADFTGAALDGADFSTCDLRGCRFDRAVARQARFIRSDLRGASLTSADLMQAMLTNALIAGASFRDSNLFRSDLARARGDDATDFSGANLKQVRAVPRGNNAQG